MSTKVAPKSDSTRCNEVYPRRSLQALLVYTILATMMFTLVVSTGIPVAFAGKSYADLLAPLVLFAITAWAAWVSYHEVWQNFEGADSRVEEELKGASSRQPDASQRVDQLD